MKKLITVLAALAVSVSFATAADAAKKGEAKKGDAAGHSSEDAFKKLDANNDGSISLEEFKAGKKDAAKAEEMFKKKDKDGDGKLTMEEFSATGAGAKKGATAAKIGAAADAPTSKASGGANTTPAASGTSAPVPTVPGEAK